MCGSIPRHYTTTSDDHHEPSARATPLASPMALACNHKQALSVRYFLTSLPCFLLSAYHFRIAVHLLCWGFGEDIRHKGKVVKNLIGAFSPEQLLGATQAAENTSFYSHHTCCFSRHRAFSHTSLPRHFLRPFHTLSCIFLRHKSSIGSRAGRAGRRHQRHAQNTITYADFRVYRVSNIVHATGIVLVRRCTIVCIP